MNLSVKNYSVSKITPNIFLSWKPAPCDVIGGGGTDTAHTQTGFGSVLTETASFLSPSKHVEDPTKPECCQISFQYFMYFMFSLFSPQLANTSRKHPAPSSSTGWKLHSLQTSVPTAEVCFSGCPPRAGPPPGGRRGEMPRTRLTHGLNKAEVNNLQHSLNVSPVNSKKRFKREK